MKKQLIKKLKSIRAESLTEALVALVIISIVMAMLPISITTASRINQSAKASKTTTELDKSTPVSATLTINYNDGTAKTVQPSIQAYEDNGFVFYEY